VVSNPLIVAIDTPTRESAVALAEATAPHIGAFKVGLGLLHGPGPALIGELAALGLPVFADAKLHDIPSQVERAARALGAAGARWVTVHASGGREMMRAAVAGLVAGSGDSGGVLAVSVLTSLDGAALAEVGIAAEPDDLVAAMAAAAAECGAEGLVCSPQEIRVAREAAPHLTIVTPGIRPAGVGRGDQRRTATPQQALADGATWLVVGRAITAAADPGAAAAAIRAAIDVV